MSYHTHKALSRETPIRCAVITISDTRTEATDKSGALMKERLLAAGHDVAAYHLVPDEPDAITALVRKLAGDIDVILLNGGTGISRRDTTFEALTGLFEKTLPGFGELFRMLSFEEIGAGAMLSRATAGVYREAVIFPTPGSTGAVRLAMDRLILPEMAHLVWELARQREAAS